MNNSQLARKLTGTGIIIFGIAALLSSLELFDLGEFFRNWWPTLVIAAGLLVLLNNPKQYGWPIVIIGFGILWQLNVANITDLNVWQLFWPIVLILIGWSVITNRAGNKPVVNDKDSDSHTALLGGFDTKNESKDYKGGQLTAILGGGALDLRHAVIKKEATLEILTLMGGVELKVPEGWIVRSKITPILGGIENKTMSHEKSNAPVLYITGTAIMGGVEVKH